jgi:hypothetical protein
MTAWDVFLVVMNVQPATAVLAGYTFAPEYVGGRKATHTTGAA